jgi:hypothetical protein
VLAREPVLALLVRELAAVREPEQVQVALRPLAVLVIPPQVVRTPLAMPVTPQQGARPITRATGLAPSPVTSQPTFRLCREGTRMRSTPPLRHWGMPCMATPKLVLGPTGQTPQRSFSNSITSSTCGVDTFLMQVFSRRT